MYATLKHKMDESAKNVIQVAQEPVENDVPNTEQLQNEQSTLTSNVRLLDQFCRLCLRQRLDLVPLQTRIQDMSVPEVFHAITGLDMILEDTYPLKTCRTCMTMLDYAYDIRQNFVESYQILKKFLLSKTQSLISNLSEYQGGVRATRQTLAERMLREYRDLRSQKETVDQHKAALKVNPYVGIPSPQEESVDLPVQIKHEPELILQTEELPYSAVAVEETKTNDDEPATEGMLQEYRDLRSQREDIDEHKAAPKLIPYVVIPSPHKEPVEPPVQIKHEPELILEPEELPYSAVAVEETITKNDEPSAEVFDKMRNVALWNEIDPYKCYICSKVFKTRKDVQGHLSEHVDMIPYRCSECTTETGQEVKIISLKRLHNHFRMHASAIKCPECPHRTCTRRAMQAHIRIYHEQSDQVEYICEQCGKKFLNKRYLYNHMIFHKALNEQRFPCSYCDKKFSSKFTQIRHERIHTGEKPYQCHACSESFRLSSTLSDHISKIHTKSEQVNDGPILTCKFEGCDFSTTKQRIYHKHKAKHKFKFQCTQCSQRFRSKYHLQRHLYVHTGVNDFHCQMCYKSFRYKVGSEYIRQRTVIT